MTCSSAVIAIHKSICERLYVIFRFFSMQTELHKGTLRSLLSMLSYYTFEKQCRTSLLALLAFQS